MEKVPEFEKVRGTSATDSNDMLPLCRITMQLQEHRIRGLSLLVIIGVLFLLHVGSTRAQLAPLTLGASLLPEGEVDVVYEADLAITGGVFPYTVTLVKGSLPAGLGIDNAGVIAGTPAPLAKSAGFTVAATDRSGSSVSKKFKIKVFKALSIKTASLKALKEGNKGLARLKATGGKKPYTWSIVTGDVPSGLTFDSITGKIAGIPEEAGNFDLTFEVADPLGGKAQATFSLWVDPAIGCSPAPPGSGIVQFVTDVLFVWHKFPLITVSGKQGEPGINFAFEAIDCWNMRLDGMGTSFRIGPVVHSTVVVPDAFLTLVSEAMVNRLPLPDLPESVINMGGDIIIALSEADLVSFSAQYPSKILIGIRSGQLSPLTLPNVPRNLIAHELGHAIGLGHNDDPSRLMCGRPAPCYPERFESRNASFFPLTMEEEDLLLEAYPPDWTPGP